MDHMNDILSQLLEPFPPRYITWKVGGLISNGTTMPEVAQALAVLYVDVNAYTSRLDKVCGLNWSVSYTPWGEAIICHLTINGITRSSTGCLDDMGDREDQLPTAIEEVAFKRACGMFGLGRYLQNFPVMYAAYDTVSQRWTEKSKARLYGIITQHYQIFKNSGGLE